MFKRIGIVLLLIPLLFCGAALADEEHGSLTVTVLDTTDSHNPIVEATVEVKSADGKTSYQEKTPLNGDGTVYFPTIPVGVYTVTVSKDGYLVQSKEVVITTAPQVIAMYLARDTPVLVRVIDRDTGAPIPGAELMLNNAYVGATNANGQCSVVMTRGANNNLQVKATSYGPYKETRYINSDESAIVISLSLSSINPLFLIYNSAKSPVSGAEVRVGDKIVAYSDSYGRAQLPEYTTGIQYPVTVAAKGYREYSDEFLFTPDSGDYVITLEYLTSPVKVTVVCGEKALANAQVYFDGELRGKTGSDGTFTATAEPGVTILVSATLEGYTGESSKCTVSAGAENTVTIVMQENVPTTMIGLIALSAIIALLIVILIIVGRNRIRKTPENRNTHGPTRRRESL